MATALITGGTSGIGAAFARQLRPAATTWSWWPAMPTGSPRSATELEERVRGRGRDVSRRPRRSATTSMRVAERLASTEQPVDLLVNNAGFGVRDKLTAEDTGPHEHGIDVMIRAVLILGARGRAGHAGPRPRRDHQRLQHRRLRRPWATTRRSRPGSPPTPRGWPTSWRGTGVTVTALCPGLGADRVPPARLDRTGSIPEPLWLDLDDLVTECLADVGRGQGDLDPPRALQGADLRRPPPAPPLRPRAASRPA